MRDFAAVTTCHEKGYVDYGREMLRSFDQFWPNDVTLYFYAEAFTPDYESRRIVCRDLLAACPELVAF